MTNRLILYCVIAASIFAISAGLSYLVFSTNFLSSPPSPATNLGPSPTLKVKKPKIDPSIPRTAECPLNGKLYTEGEKVIWTGRRPLAVMIENHLDSRPTSGISSADIVYEAISEGGITRYMGLFYCGIADDQTTTELAPVRSARIYFVKLVPEYDALYNHVGGAGICNDSTVNDKAKALCYISRNSIKDLDQFGRAGDFKTCHRVTNRLDREVAYEHTMACFSTELYQIAKKQNWTNVDAKGIPWDKNFVAWKFKSDAPTPGSVTEVNLSFSTDKLDYNVKWKYDSATNSYLRFNGTQPTLDLNTGEQVSAKNVVVQSVKEQGPLDEHFHMYYEVVGTGPAYIFRDGTVTLGTWAKKNDTSRTTFSDSQKKGIEFNRGQIWIELLASSRTPEYSQ